MKNRIIKFRAWDKENKKMYNCCELYITPNGEIIKVGIWRHEEEKKGAFGDLNVGDNKFIVIQFTGLKDKNEKEIFEGDIVKLIKKIEGNVVISEIFFNKDRVGFDLRFNNKKYNLIILGEIVRKFPNNSLWKNLKVIGNEFENPELLGDKK